MSSRQSEVLTLAGFGRHRSVRHRVVARPCDDSQVSQTHSAGGGGFSIFWHLTGDRKIPTFSATLRHHYLRHQLSFDSEVPAEVPTKYLLLE